MRRLGYTLTLIALFSLASFVSGCLKEEVPPPECVVDADCDVNQYCSGGKCLRAATTPKERAEGYIRKAEELLTAAKVDYKQVIDMYRNAKKEVPVVEWVDFNIALCQMKMGDTNQALPVFLSYRKKYPDDVRPVFAIGQLYALKDDKGKAMELYQEFLKDHPENLEIRNNIATIYRERKEYDKAMEQIRKIFVRDPAHPGAFNNLGLLYMAQDQLLLARMVTFNGIQAQENVKKKPDAGLYNNFGLIYLKMGQQDLAVANFRKAYKLDKTQVSANLNLGHIALAANDFASAKTHYDSVLSEDKDNFEARAGLAQCLASMKKPKEALALYQGLLKEKPGDPALLYNLGVLYFDHLKMQKEAHDTFREFLAKNYPDKKKNDMANMYLQMEVMVQQPEPEPPSRQQMPQEDQQAEPPAEGEESPQAAAADAVKQAQEQKENAEQAPAEEAPAEAAPAEAAPAEEAAAAPAAAPAEEKAEEKPADQPEQPTEGAAAAAPAEEKKPEAPAEEAAPAPPAEAPANP